MKDQTEEEQAFRHSSVLQAKLQERYNSVHSAGCIIAMICGFLIFGSLIALANFPSEMVTHVTAVIVKMALAAFCINWINAVRRRRVHCPQCGKKITYRAKYAGLGEHALIGVCLTCKIQGQTGICYGG